MFVLVGLDFIGIALNLKSFYHLLFIKYPFDKMSDRPNVPSTKRQYTKRPSINCPPTKHPCTCKISPQIIIIEFILITL